MTWRAVAWTGGAIACYLGADLCMTRAIREVKIKRTAEAWSESVQQTSDTKESSS